MDHNTLRVKIGFVEQSINFTESELDGLGHECVFHAPYIFVTAPYDKYGGCVYVIKIKQNNYKNKEAEIHCKLNRSMTISDHVGFGLSVAYESGFLFIIDYYNGGSLYYYCMSSKSEPKLLYSHQNPLMTMIKITNLRIHEKRFFLLLKCIDKMNGEHTEQQVCVVRKNKFELMLVTPLS